MKHSLRHCRILVVEDEYLLADDIRAELDDAGAFVIGPVATVEQALQLLGQHEDVDGAILDINLGGVMVFPVADLLMARGIPFLLATGYDPSSIPVRFAQVTRCDKPVNMAVVTRAIGHLVDAGSD